MPRIVAVPPRRSTLTAVAADCGRPTASIAWWTPPRVISTTSSAAVSLPASTACVAPSFIASSRLSATGSTAITLPAPAIFAALIAASPTPPQPTTHTVSPGTTRAALKIAPAPVVTAQPRIAARSSGISGSIRTQACSWTSICSAYALRFSICATGRSPIVSRGAAPLGRRTAEAMHSDIRPVTQNSHSPQ